MTMTLLRVIVSPRYFIVADILISKFRKTKNKRKGSITFKKKKVNKRGCEHQKRCVVSSLRRRPSVSFVQDHRPTVRKWRYYCEGHTVHVSF